MKKYLISYIYLISIIILSTIILSLINYFTNYSSIIIKIFIPIIATFISSIILGKKTTTKAYLEGLKFTSIYLIIMLITNYLILNNSFNIKSLIFYTLILFTGIIGSMLGINLKRK